MTEIRKKETTVENTKRHCTYPPITVTCFSHGMNPHEEASTLSQFLKHMKVESEVSIKLFRVFIRFLSITWYFTKQRI